MVVTGGTGIGGNTNIGGSLSFSSILSTPITEVVQNPSGLSTVEFLNIPSWAKVIRIVYTFLQHSSGTITPYLQYGTANGYYATNSGTTSNITGATLSNHGTGITLWATTIGSTFVMNGMMELTIPSSFQYNVPPLLTYRPVTVKGHSLQNATNTIVNITGASVPVDASAIDRVKITTGTAATFVGTNTRVFVQYF